MSKPMLKHITYFTKLCVQGNGTQTAWRDSINVFHLFNKANSQANLLKKKIRIWFCASWLICAQLMI